MHSPSSPTSGKEFTLLMALLMSIVAISIDAMLPALGIIGATMGTTDPNQPQLVISSMFAGLAIGQLIVGPLSDATGRKPVLFAGIAIYLLGSSICYLSESFSFLLAGRFVQGLGAAAPYITAMSVVRDKFSGRDMARVMSLVMMIFILVPAIAPTLGVAVMHVASWREIFLLYVGYALVVALWIMLRLEETLTKEHRRPMQLASFAHGLRTVLSNRTTVSYMLCSGLCFGGLIGYLNASQQIFHIQFAAGDMFALYFGALALMLGVASLVNSRIVGRLGMRFISMSAMRAIVATSALFLALHGLVDTITLPMFLAYATVLFFAFGLTFGNLNAIAMEPMGEIAGMASAIIGATSSILSLTFGTLIGQLYDNTLIPVAGGFFFCCGAALLMMMREKRWHDAELAKAA
jgi:DHA1 family bicyclomycin/chloramphenicol resistance-like MFS transporter